MRMRHSTTAIMSRDIRVGRGGTFLSRPAAAGAPPASISKVQEAAATTADGSTGAGGLTLNFPSPVTPGNFVSVVASCLSTTTLRSALLDGSTPMDLAFLENGTSIQLGFYGRLAGDANTNVKFTTNDPSRLNVHFAEWTLISDSLPEDGNSNEGILSSVVTTNSATPLSSNNLMIAAGAWVANDYSSGPINGFTRLTPIGGGTVWQEVAYLIQSSATMKSSGWGLSAGINWSAGMVAFAGI